MCFFSSLVMYVFLYVDRSLFLSLSPSLSLSFISCSLYFFISLFIPFVLYVLICVCGSFYM